MQHQNKTANLSPRGRYVFRQAVPYFANCRPCNLLALLAVTFTHTAQAQIPNPTPVSLTFSNSATPYTENFDTLPTSLTGSTLPSGWGFTEGGSSANTTFTAGTGSGTTGDTYSFGVGGTNLISDRALGGLQSNSLTPTIGAKFSNTSGLTLYDVTISYRGEQWRLGALTREDRLDFQYSTTAIALNDGAFTDLDTLDFVAPKTTGTTGAVDGNASGNFTNKSGLLANLGVANSSSFFIRWNDFNPSGSDDGLAVDDFSLRIDKLGTNGADTTLTSLVGPTTLTIQNGASTDSTLTATLATDSIFAGTLINGSTGKLALTKSGSGKLTLSGANTYTGATTVSNGTLALGASGSLSSLTSVALTSSVSKFDLSLFSTSQTIGALSGVADTEIILGNNTLIMDSAEDSSFSGNIVDGAADGSFTKQGTSTLTMGGSHTYSSNTDIKNGSLLLGKNDVLPDSAGLLLSGGTLKTGGYSDTTGTLTVTAASGIDLGTGSSALTFSPTTSGAWGSLLKIFNWSGSLWTPGGPDQLLFTNPTAPGFSLSGSQVQFYATDNESVPVGAGGEFAAVSGGFELIPVPEAKATFAAWFLLGMIGWRERRRRTVGR